MVDEKSKIEMTPIKLIAVTKHGITTIETGAGPIFHLIIKAQDGRIHEIATVTLGANKAEEFYKAVRGRYEILLDDSTDFSN